MLCSLTPVSIHLMFKTPATAKGRDQGIQNPPLNSSSMKELSMEGLQTEVKYLRNI